MGLHAFRFVGLAVAFAGVSRAAPPPAPIYMEWTANPALSDEFEGGQVDAQKWNVGPNFDAKFHWRGRRPSEFVPQNVSVAGGYLRLTTTARVSDVASVHDIRNDVWVNAACLRSTVPLARYGYYEARVRASQLISTSSFWLQGRYSEIDVTEAVGQNAEGAMHWQSGDMHASTHYFPHGWSQDRKTTDTVPMPTPSTEWHTYGVWWKDAKTVQYYLDGKLVSTQQPAGAFNEGMYLFFDTEVFADLGYPRIKDLTSPARNTMLVDWVRAYTLSPTQ